MARDEARFYKIDGRDYPSVTTILSVIDKSGPLMHWAANMERRAFEAALLDVLSKAGAKDPEWVLGEMAKAVTGKKAFLKEQDQAAVIGTAAHAWIEWRSRKMLGDDPGPEPKIPDAAAWACEAWKDWAKDVGFKPVAVERVVYCPDCGYAGTMDWLAEVKGILTVGDIKTAKGIYPEMFLQLRAYAHAAEHQGLAAKQAMVLRLPKTSTDPGFETMFVPDSVTVEDFKAALALWRCMRKLNGKAA